MAHKYFFKNLNKYMTLQRFNIKMIPLTIIDVILMAIPTKIKSDLAIKYGEVDRYIKKYEKTKEEDVLIQIMHYLIIYGNCSTDVIIHWHIKALDHYKINEDEQIELDELQKRTDYILRIFLSLLHITENYNVKNFIYNNLIPAVKVVYKRLIKIPTLENLKIRVSTFRSFIHILQFIYFFIGNTRGAIDLINIIMVKNNFNIEGSLSLLYNGYTCDNNSIQELISTRKINIEQLDKLKFIGSNLTNIKKDKKIIRKEICSILGFTPCNIDKDFSIIPIYELKNVFYGNKCNTCDTIKRELFIYNKSYYCSEICKIYKTDDVD